MHFFRVVESAVGVFFQFQRFEFHISSFLTLIGNFIKYCNIKEQYFYISER